MWFRSTGLGKRNDLVAEFEEIKKEGAYWILSMKTTKPVRWKIRVAMAPGDLREFARLLIKRGTVFQLAADLFSSKDPGVPPKDY